MKQINVLILFLAATLLHSFTFSNAKQRHLTEDYSVKFEAKNANGSFKDLKGVIHFDIENLEESKFNMEIKVASIQTGFFLKNKHAKNDNWFDVENHPTINFVSLGISQAENGYKARGKLTMHGIDKEITIPFTFENNVFKGDFTVNRLDFNVGSEEGLGKKVPNEIKINLIVPVEN